MVARSLLADPAERDALLAVPFTRKTPKPQTGATCWLLTELITVLVPEVQLTDIYMQTWQV